MNCSFIGDAVRVFMGFVKTDGFYRTFATSDSCFSLIPLFRPCKNETKKYEWNGFPCSIEIRKFWHMPLFME